MLYVGEEQMFFAGDASYTEHPLYKTHLCNRKECGKHDACYLAHGDAELRPEPLNAQQYLFAVTITPA